MYTHKKKNIYLLQYVLYGKNLLGVIFQYKGIQWALVEKEKKKKTLRFRGKRVIFDKLSFGRWRVLH